MRSAAQIECVANAMLTGSSVFVCFHYSSLDNRSDMVTPLNIAHTCYTVRRASQLEVFMSLLRTAKNYCQHQVPKDKLSRISTIAESAGTRVHVHLHESQAEVDEYSPLCYW